MYKLYPIYVILFLCLVKCRNTESQSVLFCDMEKTTSDNSEIVGYLNNSSFFTNSLLSSGKCVTNELSYSGEFSVKADSTNPYVASYLLKNLVPNNSLKISVMRHSSNNKAYIVASSVSGGFYMRQNVPNWQTANNDWQKIELEIKIPENLNSDLKIFLWNADQNKPSYFDDFTIMYMEDSAPNEVRLDTSVMVDKRDGIKYKTIKIGKQWWMAENLRYHYKENSITYDHLSANGIKYGRLYDWKSAKTSCPNGWHLPSDDEFIEMELLLGMDENEKLIIGPRSVNVGTQLSSVGTSGFNLLYSGVCDRFGHFRQFEENTVLWTSTELNYEKAIVREYVKSSPNSFRYIDLKGYYFSVRCVKD